MFVQEPVCASNKMKCIKNIKVDTSSCMKPCSGLTVNSLYKSEQNRKWEKLFPLYQAYNRYKKVTPYPQGYDGKNFCIAHCIDSSITSDYEWKNNLKYVRIFFDTPTFDRITKDRAAKFVDMLSAIGGTMGLLTGFSIISGVEILYFTFKIMWNLIKRNKKYT